MRVAPTESRPATSGCGRFGMNDSFDSQPSHPSPLFVQSSFVARPSTTGAWVQQRHDGNSQPGGTLALGRQSAEISISMASEESLEAQLLPFRVASKESRESRESRQSHDSSTAALDQWMEDLDSEIGHQSACPPPPAVSSHRHKQTKQSAFAHPKHRAVNSLPPPRLTRLGRLELGIEGVVPAPRTARRRLIRWLCLRLFRSGWSYQVCREIAQNMT